MGTVLFWLPFILVVLCSWFIAFLRHCARLVVEKEMSNYLSVCFSLPHFLIRLQTPPKHLLNITMLVCPNWCVFYRNALIPCQVLRIEHI